MNAPLEFPAAASSELVTLAQALRSSRGVAHKRDIAEVLKRLEGVVPVGPQASMLPVGDDCAAIPDGDGHILLAIEGMLADFVELDPWFAGYCSVMVNVSDIYAMGGRPIAVVDALWSRDAAHAATVLDGMRRAASAYGVPVVGGHSNLRNERDLLSVAILGRAGRLITSFDARPGDLLVAAVDLRGEYRGAFPHWNASTGADPERLRGDLEILPGLARDELCLAGKDISMAGVLGTVLMLLEASGVGGRVHVDRIPAPAGIPLQRWLVSTFPSMGFVLAVPPQCAAEVVERFCARGIAAAVVGECDDTRVFELARGDQSVPVWDLGDECLTGCRAVGDRRAETAHA